MLLVHSPTVRSSKSLAPLASEHNRQKTGQQGYRQTGNEKESMSGCNEGEQITERERWSHRKARTPGVAPFSEGGSTALLCGSLSMCGYIVHGLLVSKTKIKQNKKTPENNPKRSTKKNSNVNYRTYHKSKDGFRSTSHHVETGCWRWGAAATDQNSCLLVEICSLKNKCYQSLTSGLQTPYPRVHRTIGLAK